MALPWSEATNTDRAGTWSSSPKSSMPCVPPRTAPAAAELDLAGMLIDAATGAVDWACYRDQTAQELKALLDAKLQGQPALAEPLPVVLPLLEALQKSVAAAKKSARAPAHPSR